MTVYKKQSTRSGQKTYSRKWYGTLKTFSGKRKQVPLTDDKKSSETLLRRLQGEQDRLRAVGATQTDLERRRPLIDLLAEYERHLQAKGDTADYIELTTVRLQKIYGGLKAKTIDDLDSDRIASLLQTWRERRKKPLSPSTSNHYVTAARCFSRWLYSSKKTSEDTLRGLKKINARTDIKKVRRPFSPDQLQKLTRATRESRKWVRGLSPNDRATIYILAAYIGLRAKEIASLSVDSFDLTKKTVKVEAAYSKHRREDVLPLHGSLVDLLRDFLSTKQGNLFKGLWYRNGAQMLRGDLHRASIPYTEDGQDRDFHSLRHTFISSLARAGVHPSRAKELARHSTIVLTMDHYTHVETEELRESLDCLPSL